MSHNKNEEEKTFKEDALRGIGSLAEIPFNNVYSYADLLFDKPEVPFGHESIKEEVDFLKATKLADVAFEAAREGKFPLKNTKTGNSILVSDRFSSRGELRGELLRSFLKKKKEENSEQSVYEAISSAIREPQYSDILSMLKGSLVGEKVKELHGISMEEEHFNIFSGLLLQKINDKIINGDISSNLEPKQIRNDKKILAQVWENIDVEAIYHATHEISSCLQAINEKEANLRKRGYPKEADAVLALHKDIREQIDAYQKNMVTAENFIENFKNLIKTSRDGVLKNHRGFFGVIFHKLLVALNIITYGTVQIKKTDSLDKIDRIESQLNKSHHLFYKNKKENIEEKENRVYKKPGK